MNSENGSAVLASLENLNSDTSINQQLNYTSLLKARTDDLSTYIERGDQMKFAYEWAGYKMVGDDGKVLFDDASLATELGKVAKVSSDEKVRRQQAQEKRINELEAAIKKKKEEEGKK